MTSLKLGVPLREASVSFQNSPALTQLVQTNSTGHYEAVIDTCDGDYSIIFNRKGYMSVHLDKAEILDLWYMGIEMEEAGMWREPNDCTLLGGNGYLLFNC